MSIEVIQTAGEAGGQLIAQGEAGPKADQIKEYSVRNMSCYFIPAAVRALRYDRLWSKEYGTFGCGR